MGKHCIECRNKFPLWMFKTDIRSYTIPEAQKKVRRCRLCINKESRKGSVVRWAGNGFETKTLNWKQRMKELLSK